MDYASQQRNVSRHLLGIAFVILFHVALAYALVTGLARKVVEVVKAPLETKIIEEIKKALPDKPPPPPPKLAPPPPPPFVPPPEVNIAVTPPPAATITTVTHTPPPPVQPAKIEQPRPVEKPRQVARTEPSVGKCPDSDSIYPSSARRLEQEGTTLLRVLVDTEGRVTQVEMDKSSGVPALDEAARNAVTRCRGGKPGTAEGKPEQTWMQVKYTFKLE